MRRIVIMAPFLTRLATVATSLVLALPPGWCAVWTQHGVPQPQPVKISCCHRAKESQPCKAPDSPTDGPSGKCCCSWEATVPNEPVKVADAGVLLLMSLAEKTTGSVGQVGVNADNPLDFSGPRLHVLHCVWRC